MSKQTITPLTGKFYIYDYEEQEVCQSDIIYVINKSTLICKPSHYGYVEMEDELIDLDYEAYSTLSFTTITAPKGLSVDDIYNDSETCLLHTIKEYLNKLNAKKQSDLSKMLVSLRHCISQYYDDVTKAIKEDEFCQSHKYIFNTFKIHSYYDNLRDKVYDILSDGGVYIRAEDRDDAPKIFIPYKEIISIQSYSLRNNEYVEFTRSDGEVFKRLSTEKISILADALKFIISKVK